MTAFDFRPHDRPRVGVCTTCGRELVRGWPTVLQDVDGFVQCRPRGQPYQAASSNPETPDGRHHLEAP